MAIRKIERNDLSIIAKLVNDNSLETRDDIYFEHSRICFSDEGEVLCFIVLREYSLIDFFNGEIPADENTEYDEDYEEGEEWFIKEDIEYFKDHYEIIAMYHKESMGSPSFNNTIVSVENNDGKGSIGIIWTLKEQPKYSRFYNFNNKVWLDIPMID